MSDTYTLDACWGDWHFTTTASNLNGRIDCQGVHKNGSKETLHWTLEDNGNFIVWKDEGDRWDLTLNKIGENVWHAKGSHGSHPNLMIFKH